MATEKAKLRSGETVNYLSNKIGEGQMKEVYFTSDKKHVIAFYRSGTKVDPERLYRLEAIIGKYNPTKDSQTGNYWKKLYCWPFSIVEKPRLGIMVPAYPDNFYFKSGNFKGKEKQGRWFVSPKLRKLLPKSEVGDWLSYLKISICTARATRRLHTAGLAHSDLSDKNVLIDPSSGMSIIIDIDSLVVPDLYPPDVIGTGGYIAPEVISTMHLNIDDSRRILPSSRTDQHALAVLIYEYLLSRHPLRGPKVHSLDVEEDERLSMGKNAIFIEDEYKRDNRVEGISTPYTILGRFLTPLMKRAFEVGLHDPEARPTASEWEKGLVRSTDLLMACGNNRCKHKWFIFDGTRQPKCPFCGWIFTGIMPILNFYKRRKNGQYQLDDRRLIVRQNTFLYKWHVFDNVFPGESADKTSVGYFTFHKNKWLLVNKTLDSLEVIKSGTDPQSRLTVPIGGFVELNEGTQILLSKTDHGRLATVQMIGG